MISPGLKQTVWRQCKGPSQRSILYKSTLTRPDTAKAWCFLGILCQCASVGREGREDDIACERQVDRRVSYGLPRRWMVFGHAAGSPLERWWWLVQYRWIWIWMWISTCEGEELYCIKAILVGELDWMGERVFLGGHEAEGGWTGMFGGSALLSSCEISHHLPASVTGRFLHRY